MFGFVAAGQGKQEVGVRRACLFEGKGRCAVADDGLDIEAAADAVERFFVDVDETNIVASKILLSTFCGIKVSNIQKPAPVETTISTNKRPEMLLFDNQLQLSSIKEKALNTQITTQTSIHLLKRFLWLSRMEYV